MPRLRIEFVQILSDVINDLAGAARPVEIRLYGADLNALESYAKSMEPEMSKVEGIEDFFSGVVENCGCAMGVDVIHFSRRDSCTFQRRLHRVARTYPGRIRLGQMMIIGRNSVACDFRDDVGISISGRV